MGEPRTEDETAELRRELRRFHWTGADNDMLEVPPVETRPLLLARVTSPADLRHAYPLHIPGVDLARDGLVLPVAEWLSEVFEHASFEGDTHRVIRDNRLRLEQHLRKQVGAGTGPARTFLADAGRTLVNELGLSAPHDARLIDDLAALEERDGTGVLVGLSPGAPLLLLSHIATTVHAERWRSFHERRSELVTGLHALLEVEGGKDGAGAKHVPQFGATFIDSTRLSKTMGPWRGSTRMDPVRRARVERARDVLASWGDALPPLPVLHNEPEGSLPTLPTPSDCRRRPAPIDAAIAAFDEAADRLTRLFVAIRTAALEIEGRYRPDVHDVWFESFDWTHFSEDERRLMPSVVAIDTTERLQGEAMAAFSRVLRSNRPIHVFATLHTQSLSQPDGPRPVDLGYVAISHRSACVHQGSLAAPTELASGFRSACQRTRPAVHLIHVGSPRARLGQWLHAAGALEGRAHPLFRYDPDEGETWAARFHLSGNPAPEDDWPAYADPIADGSTPEDVAVTFADYALLDPDLAGAFRVVPDGVPLEDLIPLGEALTEGPEAAERVPFVWGVRADGTRFRLAASRALVEETSRRRDFWHTLQELGGVHNAYVESASRTLRAEFEAVAADERERLRADHDAALERTRREAAKEAMTALARTLLGLDAPARLAASVQSPRKSEPETLAPSDAGEASPADAPTPVPETDGDDTFVQEAWINTPLCTSCNDCTAINPKLFVYDENKQAVIGDLAAGTFAQLVQAAEKCPARCIHPGQPQNPDEPGLEALIARAAPFNE